MRLAYDLLFSRKNVAEFFCLFFLCACGVLRAETPFDRENTQLKTEWMFQVDNEPTVDKIRLEISYTKDLAARIAKMEGAPDFADELVELEKISKTLPDMRSSDKDRCQKTYFDVRAIKRAIFFKNPLIDFEKVLLIDNPYPKGKPGDATDEWAHEARHRNGYMAEPGGSLVTVGLHPGTEVKNLLPEYKGSFWRPDLSYDAKKILFSYQPVGEKSFHIYECNLDGSDAKQLTFGDYDDLDPVFAPDGKILFCSSRQHSYVRCMPMTHSFALTRCDADGKNIYVISANGEPEYLPSIMNDGRVIFTRWEYTDKALWRVQSLWTCNPDGTNQQTFWGTQSVWPDLLGEARSIPNSNKVMFTAIGHHAWFNGSIGIVDQSVGLDYPLGLERVTRECDWPEVGNGPSDPPPSVDYHQSGNIFAYKTPYPLSEEYFLVSAREGGHLYSGSDHGWFFRLYLMDIYGNKELIYRGKTNAYHAIPVRERQLPQIKPDLVEWPKIGSGEKPQPGILYSNDVFQGAPEILKEKGKAIRVILMDPKTYTTWHKTVQHDGPAVSVFQAEGVKRILGTTPIEEDGSVAFEVPPGEALFFEMLDAEGRAIHVMRTFTSVMPGEVRGCFGCHESTHETVGFRNAGMAGNMMGEAIKKGAKPLTPPTWGSEESVSYQRFVQPVLDKHCAECHQNPEHEAYSKLNMTFRPSTHRWNGWVYSRNDPSPFAEPYLQLVSGPTGWGAAKARDERNVPKNLAGLFIVEAYHQNDPDNLKTLPPYSAYSPVSPLVKNAMSGEHHGVKVSGTDLERLIAWVDCNGPYLGDEEIREMYDPVSFAVENIPPIRPRIATAPRINRFDIRQDGDTKAMSGELKLMPNRIPNFDPNKAARELMLKQYLDEVKDENLDVEIISAFYGSGDRGADVTGKIKENFNGTRFVAIAQYNDAFGDPLRNVVKRLRVTYKINGTEKTVNFEENAPILLPK